jgi:hypothetical protein
VIKKEALHMSPRLRSKAAGKGKTKAELQRLLKRAQSEVAKLLQDDEAGTLTRLKMKTRLKDVEKTLDEMEPLECGQ